MRFILYFIAALTTVSPALAVCTTVDRITDTEMCMSRGAGTRCIPFTDLSTGSRTSHARQLTGLFQTIMETRVTLTSTVSDEESRFNPPHLERFYLGDSEGVHHHNASLDTYLIGRCDIITVIWDGSAFVVGVRTARKTHTPEGERIP